jgi:diacylglycerol kinase family enzyme
MHNPRRINHKKPFLFPVNIVVIKSLLHRSIKRLAIKVKHSLMTILKRHAKCRDVIYRQGRTVTVTSPYARTKTEVDGDPGPRLPVEIHIIPQAISVLVPKEAKPAGIRTRILRAIG